MFRFVSDCAISLLYKIPVEIENLEGMSRPVISLIVVQLSASVVTRLRFLHFHVLR